MEEVPWNADQTVEYEKKIQELGRQIKQLQEAANPKDYSGKIKCQNISCLVGMYFFSLMIIEFVEKYSIY